MRSGPVRAAMLAVAVTASGGCADRLPVDDAGHHTATPPRLSAPAAPAPPAIAPPQGPLATGLTATGPTAAPDACGAAGLAYLVGKPRTEIPIPADLTHRRVICSTCVISHDVVSDRLTIIYDSATNLVTTVACG